MHAKPETKPRIGLVLGAGGVVGASYIAGALEGIRRATGWEPADADVVVGTSAGAFIGAITAVGIPPALMYARCTGETPDGAVFSDALQTLGERMDQHNEGYWLTRYWPPARLPRPLLASPRLALEFFRDFKSTRLEMLVTGLVGEGLLSTQRSIGAVIRTALAQGWPSEKKIWVVTCNLDSGRRVVFGKADSPKTDLHLAVSAATAIPGVFAPVVIDGARYCDAGVWNPCNLGVVEDLELDLVVCVNPLSGADECSASSNRPALQRSRAWLQHALRRRVDQCVSVERSALERRGTKVYVLHPVAQDLAEFPWNSMDLTARPRVMRRAAQTICEKLSSDANWQPLAQMLQASARAGYC